MGFDVAFLFYAKFFVPDLVRHRFATLNLTLANPNAFLRGHVLQTTERALPGHFLASEIILELVRI